jgi:YjbE family integral membrane protein
MDFSTVLENFNLATFGQIMFANVVLSGDNAVLIGLAAAGLPAAQRSRAILFGMLFATVLRIIFSIFAVYLLEVPGLLLIGGLLLLWIAYGFFKELRDEKHEEEDPEGHEDGAGGKSMMQALKQIVIADVSMSLYNVLAIAGIARGNMPMLDPGAGGFHHPDGGGRFHHRPAARQVSLDCLCRRCADCLDRH